jgi:hypothetical protein
VFVLVGQSYTEEFLLYFCETISIYWNLKSSASLFSDYTSKILDNIMKNTMKNTLLITAAVTALAGVGLASAQSANDRREAPPAAAHDQKTPEGKTEGTPGREPGGIPPKPAAQVPEKGKPTPTAQVPEKGKPARTAQTPEKGKPAPTAQTPEKGKPAPTAQEKPVEPTPQTTGQGPSQSPKPGMAPQPAALSTEQHVKIRETLRGEKVEHLKSVQFSITVGEAIPRTVHLYRFPVSVMTYAPQYRDYEYFMVGDEILVVDPSTLRIVAVIPA